MASPEDNTGRQYFQIGTSSDEKTSATFSVSSSDKTSEKAVTLDRPRTATIELQSEACRGERSTSGGGSSAYALPVRQIRANSARGSQEDPRRR